MTAFQHLAVVANCTESPLPPPPEDDPACSSLTGEDSCNGTPACVWCKSVAVQPACYAKEDASKLPPGVFECAGEAAFASRHRRDIV